MSRKKPRVFLRCALMLPLCLLSETAFAQQAPAPEEPLEEAPDPGNPQGVPLPVPAASSAEPLAQPPSPPSAEDAGFDLEASLGQGARPMTADEAAHLAVAASFAVQRAQASIEAAEASTTSALVPLFPRVEITARYMRIGGFDDGSISVGGGGIPTEQALALAGTVADPPAQTLLTGIIEQTSSLTSIEMSTPRNQIGFRAALTFPLSDLFLTLLPAYRASQAQIELEEHRLLSAQSDVELQAREAFYRYAGARGALEVTRAAVALAQEHNRRMEALASAELAAEADRLTALSHLAAARSAQARAQSGVVVTREALLSLLQIQVTGELAISESLITTLPPPPAVSEDLLETAYAARPEIQALEQLVVAQRHAERAATGSHFPHLVLVAGGDVANPNQRVFPMEEEFTPSWEVGAVLTWSPSDTVQANAQARRARAMQDAAQADLENLRQGVRLQVIGASQEHQAARAVMEAAAQRIEAAEGTYQARLAELQAGEVVFSELLDAELEISRARLELLQAGVDIRVAVARLHHAMGATSTLRGD